MNYSISAIVTAAGQNRRMQRDLARLKLPLKNKLLLDIQGKAVISHTIMRLLKANIDECIIVLGHYTDQIMPTINDLNDSRIKIVQNDPVDVDLSQSLLHGVQLSNSDICLCAAGDQPSVTSRTFKNLIDAVENYKSPERILSVLSRGRCGYIKSAEGLGMPFACCRDLLLKYLPGKNSNLNPILREMVKDDIVFYAAPHLNSLELLNINKYDDYMFLSEKFQDNTE
ncbi:nucleotidyltransferase family protein [Methanobacterium alcaliphilum]|uniref:nucleotidyltransferase family protein n=1 Tax=Methanobacterium alcaliphilum TaxID=392018 RepID=UPI00200AB929|nr:NTP transferase domain-containing protein [Methanobacterium alcaliphilum]MCK9151689.1 NTP transferase domain-containing protein [Methanobacterium alcaliphilum]